MHGGAAYVFGWLLLVLGAAMLLPAAIGFAFEEPLVIRAFLVSAMAAAFLGGGLVLALKGKGLEVTRRRGLLILAAGWLLLPVCAAVPLYAASAQSTVTGAYFEAVSGLTTTGATIYTDLAAVPRGVLLWRALLQWLGGLGTLLGFFLVAMPRNGTAVARTWNAGGVLGAVLPLYGALTAACLVSLIASGLPAFDAFCLALSAVSTGGFMPRNGTIELYGAPAALLVLTVFMFAGGVSFFWLRALIAWDWPRLRAMREPVWIALAAAVAGLAVAGYVIVTTQAKSFEALPEVLILGLASAMSVITTSGFAISGQTQDAIPYMPLVILCLIGGGAYSTAGGLKVFRLIAMLRQSGRELRLLVFPHGVSAAGTARHLAGADAMLAVWAVFAAMLAAVCVLALTVSAAGIPLPGAFLAAAGALSNIGPVYGWAGLPESGGITPYGEMAPFAQLALCAGMVLGRAEVLLLLSLINFAYWRP